MLIYRKGKRISVTYPPLDTASDRIRWRISDLATSGGSLLSACGYVSDKFVSPDDTVDENVVSSSLAGTVQRSPIWSKLNLSATQLAMQGRVQRDRAGA